MWFPSGLKKLWPKSFGPSHEIAVSLSKSFTQAIVEEESRQSTLFVRLRNMQDDATANLVALGRQRLNEIDKNCDALLSEAKDKLTAKQCDRDAETHALLKRIEKEALEVEERCVKRFEAAQTRWRVAEEESRKGLEEQLGKRSEMRALNFQGFFQEELDVWKAGAADLEECFEEIQETRDSSRRATRAPGSPSPSTDPYTRPNGQYSQPPKRMASGQAFCGLNEPSLLASRLRVRDWRKPSRLQSLDGVISSLATQGSSPPQRNLSYQSFETNPSNEGITGSPLVQEPLTIDESNLSLPPPSPISEMVLQERRIGKRRDPNPTPFAHFSDTSGSPSSMSLLSGALPIPPEEIDVATQKREFELIQKNNKRRGVVFGEAMVHELHHMTELPVAGPSGTIPSSSPAPQEQRSQVDLASDSNQISSAFPDSRVASPDAFVGSANQQSLRESTAITYHSTASRTTSSFENDSAFEWVTAGSILACRPQRVIDEVPSTAAAEGDEDNSTLRSPVAQTTQVSQRAETKDFDMSLDMLSAEAQHCLWEEAKAVSARPGTATAPVDDAGLHESQFAADETLGRVPTPPTSELAQEDDGNPVSVVPQILLPRAASNDTSVPQATADHAAPVTAIAPTSNIPELAKSPAGSVPVNVTPTAKAADGVSTPEAANGPSPPPLAEDPVIPHRIHVPKFSPYEIPVILAPFLYFVWYDKRPHLTINGMLCFTVEDLIQAIDLFAEDEKKHWSKQFKNKEIQREAALQDITNPESYLALWNERFASMLSPLGVVFRSKVDLMKQRAGQVEARLTANIQHYADENEGAERELDHKLEQALLLEREEASNTNSRAMRRTERLQEKLIAKLRLEGVQVPTAGNKTMMDGTAINATGKEAKPGKLRAMQAFTDLRRRLNPDFKEVGAATYQPYQEETISESYLDENDLPDDSFLSISVSQAPPPEPVVAPRQWVLCGKMTTLQSYRLRRKFNKAFSKYRQFEGEFLKAQKLAFESRQENLTAFLMRQHSARREAYERLVHQWANMVREGQSDQDRVYREALHDIEKGSIEFNTQLEKEYRALEKDGLNEYLERDMARSQAFLRLMEAVQIKDEACHVERYRGGLKFQEWCMKQLGDSHSDQSRDSGYPRQEMKQRTRSYGELQHQRRAAPSHH